MSRFIRATPKCSNRLFEWISAFMMLQIGVLVLVTHYIYGNNPQLAFRALLDLGLGEPFIGAVFLGFGTMRMVALRLNGSWILGPHIRVICALVSMLIWGQLFFGIIDVFYRTGELYLSWGIWDSLLVGEYFSIKRATLDIKHPTRETAIKN